MSTKSYDAIKDLRRLRVSSLLLRQLSQREIVEALARSKLINPDTKKPYSLGTVNNDIKYLRTEWREQASQEIHSHQSRIWAELQEIKREAWAQKDLKTVLTCLAQERSLLGLDAAKAIKATIDLPSGDLSMLSIAELEEAELNQLLDNLQESVSW